MSKQFYTEGTGADQVLKEDADNIVKVFNKAEDIDVSELEDNEVVFTTGDVLDTALIAQSVTDKVEETIEKIVNNSGMPVGSILSIDNDNDIAGWLKCDGSSFDISRYPFLYAALNSDKVPLEVEADEWEIDKELFTGQTFFGHPVYSYSFYDNTTRSTSWAVCTINNDSYWPYTYNVSRIINVEATGSHNATYRNGNITNYLYQMTNMKLDSETGLYVPQATTQLQIYYGHQSLYDANDPRLVTIYYTKVEDDYTNAKYKYIKALSGVQTEAEATQVTDAIEAYKNKLTDTSGVPCGTLIEGRWNEAPAGYLKADGSTFDEDKYPILYAKLGNSNVLPIELSINDSWVLNEDVVTGKWYDGHPVYRYTVQYTTATSSATWYTIPNSLVLIDDLKISKIIDSRMSDTSGANSNYTYLNGTEPFKVFKTSTGLQFYVPSMSSNAYNASYTDQKYISFEYVKTEDDYTNAQFKYIKATSGINPDESDSVVDAVKELKEKVAYSSLPVGNVIELANNDIVPNGYLLADGSTFDEEKYPLLYAYLNNSNVLPNIYIRTVNERPDWYRTNYATANVAGSTYFASSNDCYPDGGDNGVFEEDGILEIHGEDTSYVHYHAPDGTITSYFLTYRNDDQTFLKIPVKKGGYIIQNTSAQDNTTKAARDWCTVMIWYYHDHKYIKATSGIEDSSEESSELVNALADLKDKVAYSSLPLGNLIELPTNDVTPTGYLLADGSEFDETKYPLLYAYLGNTNKLPEIGAIPDYENPIYLNYSGAQDNTRPVDPTEIQTFTMEQPGIFIVETAGNNGGAGWVLKNGVLISKWGGGSNGWASGAQYEIPVVTGDIITIRFSYRSGFMDYQTLIPYKTFKYIKAVTGLEENTDEAAEVADAISTATTALQNNYDAFVDEVNNRDYRTEYVLWEGANTYTNIPNSTTLADSLLNYDTIKWYARRSASATADYLPVMITDHRQIEEALTSTGTYTYLFPGYGTEYRELKFNAAGLSVTAVSGSECIYRIVGVGKRS